MWGFLNMSRSELITVDDIWKLTSGGEDVFARDIKVSYTTNVSAPWRKDGVPSLRLKNRGGIVYYTDYGGDQSHGSAIDFTMKLYNLSFPEAMEKIKGDFNILSKPKEYAKTWKKTVAKPKEPLLYEFDSTPFSSAHHSYWNHYYLDEEFVTREGDIYAVKNWAVNKKKQPIGFGEIVFCYVFKDESGKDTGLRKFLRLGPDVEKKDKWRTNVPNTKIWYLYKYIGKDIPFMFVAKSNKDALCTMKQEISSVATQSENDIILKENIPMLQIVCPRLVLNFGSDPQGTQASINVSKEYNLEWFNTPKSYLKHGINDNAEFQKEFGEECFKELLKLKKWQVEKK